MQKDVIYIDTEDDITGIIGKVKSASNKIVALVPPKRIGVLQSAVNLKLLQKAANGKGKRVVLITNDHSLIALAAGLSMPVAKNLQSKPEVPQMQAPNQGEEEVIEGQSLPVGDFASSIGVAAALKKDKTVAEEISEKVDLGSAAVSAAEPSPAPIAGIKKKSGVPNFNLFRKRLFLIGGGLLLLVVFLVWALAFAPRATITITARTTAVNVDKALNLDSAQAASDPASLKLKSVMQQTKKAVATEFDATGTKDIGNKATGTISVRNCDYNNLTLPAGTAFVAASGHVFVSTAAVAVPNFSGSSSSCSQGGASSGKVSVAVEAKELGPEYNIAPQGFSVSGYSAKLDGITTAAMSGGTKETVKVVSQADVDKAKGLLPQPDQNAAKAELEALFTPEQKIIDESFDIAKGNEVVTPNVGEQAARAKITQETTYSLTGLEKADISAILKQTVDAAIKDKPDQQVYGYGEDEVSFQIYQKQSASAATVKLVSTGYIGPKIDTAKLAKDVSGKRYGEIQALVMQIPGIENVDIDFSPFWVTTAPSPEKIDIKFSVSNE